MVNESQWKKMSVYERSFISVLTAKDVLAAWLVAAVVIVSFALTA